MLKALLITLLVSKEVNSCGLDFLAYKVINGVTGAYNYAVNGFKTSLDKLKEIHHDVSEEKVVEKSTPPPYSEALVEYFNSRQNAENQNGMEGNTIPPDFPENYNIPAVQNAFLYKHRPPKVLPRTTTVKTPKPKPKKWEDWFISTTEYSRKDHFAVPITDVPMRGNLYDKAVATIKHGEPVNRFAVPMRGNLYEKLVIPTQQPRSYVDLKKELQKPIEEPLIKPSELRFAQDRLRMQNVINYFEPEDFIKYNILKEALGHGDKFHQSQNEHNRGYSIYGEAKPEPTIDRNVYDYLAKISENTGNDDHEKFINFKKAAEELKIKHLNEIYTQGEGEGELKKIKMDSEEDRLPLYEVTVPAERPKYEPNAIPIHRYGNSVSDTDRHYGPGARWSETKMKHYLNMVRDGRFPRIQAAMRPLKLDTPPTRPMKNLLKMVKPPLYEVRPEKDVISSNPKHDDEKRKIGKALAKMEKLKKEKKSGVTRKPNVIREMLQKENHLFDDIPELRKTVKSSAQDDDYDKREYFKPKMLESYRKLVDLNML
ncbi:hypothetical protein JYU34_012442 [Plutella xylostella]|uniref:Uncharacterized protein n=1 Tax=Plutella xylostella TaxID=51655 RepID=A0ABQ7QBD5_PLUXY|nr:hypothetical protein JYU34_012442 [Plutella xylostella]